MCTYWTFEDINSHGTWTGSQFPSMGTLLYQALGYKAPNSWLLGHVSLSSRIGIVPSALLLHSEFFKK